MNKLTYCLVVLALSLTVVAAAWAQDTPAGDAKNGKDLFVKYTCYGCHGFSGQNGPGNRLVPMKMVQAVLRSDRPAACCSVFAANLALTVLQPPAHLRPAVAIS